MTMLRRLLALLLIAILPAPAQAEPSDIAASARGVVRVVIISREMEEELYPVSHGTGFSVGNDRFVTNAHVVAEAVEDGALAIGIVPSEGGDAVYARLVSVSERNDLALLEATVPMKLPALTIAGSPAATGAVTAIGYPMNVDRAQGLEAQDVFRAVPPVTSTGFLSGRRPSVEFDTLLHTAPIARGNSGGPLVDDCGRLVGVNSFGAESEATEAEFFFAVSTRELLPFLRANNVTPRVNSSPCRSIAELNAEESARADRANAAAAARNAADEAALARRTEDLRRTISYQVIDARSNGTALSLVALMLALGAGAGAVFGHMRENNRLRAIASGVALLAVGGAAVAWLLRPEFADIEGRVADELRADSELVASGAIPPPAIAGESGTINLTCTLDPDRSRVVTAPEEEVDLAWAEGGCVNSRTQYGNANGRWTRVFVPAEEAAVSVNSYDPLSRDYIVERYLLDRDTMEQARTARAGYQAGQCGGGQDGASTLGNAQAAVIATLPENPNERLIYRCRRAASGN